MIPPQGQWGVCVEKRHDTTTGAVGGVRREDMIPPQGQWGGVRREDMIPPQGQWCVCGGKT